MTSRVIGLETELERAEEQNAKIHPWSEPPFINGSPTLCQRADVRGGSHERCDGQNGRDAVGLGSLVFVACSGVGSASDLARPRHRLWLHPYASRRRDY